MSDEDLTSKTSLPSTLSIITCPFPICQLPLEKNSYKTNRSLTKTRPHATIHNR